MNIFLKKIIDGRWLFAVLAGLTLAVSFPKMNVAGFAWVAHGLILFCAIGKTPRRQFWIGYVAGVAHYLASLYWLLFIPFPAGAVAGWIALSAYLALYPAFWVWLCWKIFSKFCGGNDAKTFLTTTWNQRAIWAMSCAVIWVALEMVIARLFSGFPWNFLGITQYKVVPLIQIAAFTGVYGVAFLLVWFGVSLCVAGILLVQRPQAKRAWSGEIALPALVVAIVFALGARNISDENPDAPTLKVALVQPSIPQTLIFDPSQNETRFEKIMELSRKALAEKPDVLIWPEASIPPLHQEQFSALTNLIVTHGVWMIFGADDVEFKPLGDNLWETNYFNSAFLFSPEGNAVETYRKRRLVIFGEYIPLERWLPFMKWFTPIDGGFTPGEGPVAFVTESPRANISTLICFEDVFPHFAREHVNEDTDFLLNLTNDGWFGNSAAQWQQAVNGLFRAIENGLPLVRCTNNGLTCWIDRFGRLRKIFRDESGNEYSEGFMIAEIPLLTERREPTFYRKHGDWFGWGCVALSGGMLLVACRKTAVPK